ncbi:hypothetical protein BDN72DRAFT_901951 [Pluteus cervinus]|uniref:Uncharacterized protein n=1 Tax=Pluteus cervinus TaxID=181527 RepID=A0ACD3ADH6_9AGAR|nr:hypothetical protein BDN72DRAFT_901951 [Pluteus cervinus]
MVSFKSFAILSVFALSQQALAQVSSFVPAGICEPCLGPILTTSTSLVARPCSNPSLKCCRLWTNTGICLPVCPRIPIIDPLPTPIPIGIDPIATPFNG